MTYKYISNLILIVIISLIAGGCLEGNSSIKSDLPQGFPQDFPFESSLKRIHVENKTNFEENGLEWFYHLSFESEKSHEKLYKWYKKNTINDEWQITGYMLMDKNGDIVDKSKKTPQVGPILGTFLAEAAKDSKYNKEHGIITIQIGEITIPMEKKHQCGIGLLYFNLTFGELKYHVLLPSRNICRITNDNNAIEEQTFEKGGTRHTCVTSFGL